VTAQAEGYIHRLDAELVGRASMLLGAGRATVGDTIDPAAGIVIHRKPGAAVTTGDPILELHYNDGGDLAGATRLATRAINIAAAPPPAPTLVLDHVT
jgi:thymidine phosphorylase